MYYIGVDLGTSSVKLLLLSDEGICNIVSREYPVSYPQNGWSEQNPEDWWIETVEGIKQLTADIDKTQVKAISFGGQMHGLVILDNNDNVIRPAILWNDTRAQKETDYLNNVIGKEKLVDLTGNIAFAGFTAPKIMWLKNNEPVNFNKISKIMLPKDYIAYRLTGVHSTDVSDASGMLLLDVKNRCWSKEMLEITGINEKQLPTLFESYEITGKLKPEIASEFGFSDVNVIAGAGDNAAAAVGTAAINNGSCNISLGTSGTVFVASDKFVPDYKNAIHNFCHANGKYHYMACILSAASCNKWWLENILNTKDYVTEYENYNSLGDNEVIFLPYLMGERSPLNDSDIRGMFYGISMSTTRQNMSVAVLEGIAFALKQNIEIIKSMGIDIAESKICGGGTNNKLWLKIIASVLNIELHIQENQEGASYGSALLAAKGCDKNIYNNLINNMKVVEVIKPDIKLVEKYKSKYAKFLKMYPALKALYINP